MEAKGLGNASFGRKEWDEACGHYTRALDSAEPTLDSSLELVLLSNRADCRVTQGSLLSLKGAGEI